MKDCAYFNSIEIPEEDFEKYTKFLHDTHNLEFHKRRAEVMGLTPLNTLISTGVLIDRAHVKIGKNVLFSFYCYVNGDVTVEDNVMIGPHCAVNAGTLGEHSQIPAPPQYHMKWQTPKAKNHKITVKLTVSPLERRN